jgi:hypothetical protein
VLAAGTYLGVSYRRSRGPGQKTFTFTLVANLMAVLPLLLAGEIAVRLISVRTSLGPTVAGTRLLPRSWEVTRLRNAQLLQSAPPETGYFVGDTLLGWTVGRSRSGKGGMYLSSTEGIRSPRQGMSYADNRAPQRVALVGDSFTFSFEGPFEDSWGAALDSALGARAVVLNFGVDGYGVDQSYLRYLRDVRPWHPNVTVFGFIQHDFTRTQSVYAFITFPEWGYPFSKPRFVLRAGKPALQNTPLVSAEAIIRKASVTDLPFLGLDAGYDPAEWQWHPWYASYLLRYLTSRFPRYPLERPEFSETARVRVSTALLRDFVQSATADGTIPILVYFPARSDFDEPGLSAKDSVLAALRASGIPTVDLTSCVAAVGRPQVFIPGRPHYAGAANRAVARCLLPKVQQALLRNRDG